MDPLGSSLSPSVRPEIVEALLPGFGGASFCEVNLDREATRWREQYPELFKGGAHPLLDPSICQRFLDDIHTCLGITWSFGGYLEDRHHLLQGSYLERAGGFVHLGVDFNVPESTRIAAPRAGRVLLVDDDHDRDGGWGPRVFFKLDGKPPDDAVLIFAHLKGIEVGPGSHLAQGTVFAEVGGPPDNGNWVPHLHVQAIRSENLFNVLVQSFTELDGYGSSACIQDLRKDFPDPLPLIGWR